MVVYPAESLYVICRDRKDIKSIVYLRGENHKLMAGLYSPNGFTDVILGETPESKTLVDDLLYNRISLNTYLCCNGFIEFIKDTYDQQTIELIYQALVINYGKLNDLKTIFERLADEAAKKWRNIILFTNRYDPYFLMHHPEKTVITSYSDLSIINSITPTTEERFQLCLSAEIKMQLYALGPNYENFCESTNHPNLLRIAAKNAQVRGYVSNNLRMRFINGEAKFEYVTSINEAKEK